MTVEELFHGLVEGKEYIMKNRLQAEWDSFQSGRLRFFVPQPNLYMDEDGDYFHWNHYGSSANEVSLDSLKFLLEKIFECGADDFVELDKNSVLDVINEGR